MAEQAELNLDPETMPLEQLRAMADKDPEPEPVAAVADIEIPKEDSDPEPEPEQYVVKSEIDLGDGSGVQVFTGTGATELEALRDQNSKLVEAQRHASKKIHELATKVKSEDTRTEQQRTDDEYVIAQRLQKEPTRAIRDVVTEVIAQREAEKEAILQARQRFVDSHTDYVADDDNANRILSEIRRLGYKESDESLEKAYQSLKASGLLKLKVEEAGGTTEAEPTETQRIAEPVATATQPRSPKRASTVSTRSASATVVRSGPTEDELYSLPLDKLKQMANEQMSKVAE